MLDTLTRRAIANIPPCREELEFLVGYPDIDALIEAAHTVTVTCASRVFNFCTIINAKSGQCSENCRWCAQSAHFPTAIPVTPVVSVERAKAALERTKANGIRRLSYVTAGRKLSARELREITPVIEATSHKSVEICASFGLQTETELRALGRAGLTRFHCNLETSERFFSEVCTSHTYEDKLKTLRAARRAGLDLCSGGLFGIGETMTDRIDLAYQLRLLDIPSIPMNFLNPIPGTPLADQPPLSDRAILRTISAFRLINPRACLRFAGGRLRLSDNVVKKALYAGINGAIVGDLLTTPGSTVERERALAREAGYTIEDI
ncbi:MAG: biotin synthase BioB [Sutterella wadsworthensis]|nr:biotin synthase BioB [Sutterella wadsworthensis]